MAEPGRRTLWRFRTVLYVHWFLLVLFAIAAFWPHKAGAGLFPGYFQLALVLYFLAALLKGWLIRRPFEKTKRIFWILTVIDVVFISLIHQVGYYLFELTIMLYLCFILAATIEIFPGELLFTSLLCVAGYVVNIAVRWNQSLARVRPLNYADLMPFFSDLVGVLSMLLFAFLAYRISKFDQEITDRLNDALRQKEQSLAQLAMAHVTLEEKYVESYTLNLVQENIFQQLDRVKVLENAADILMGVLGGKACYIYLYFPKENVLRCLVRTGTIETCRFQPEYPAEGNGSIPETWRKGSVTDESSLNPQEREALEGQGIHSVLCVPLSGRERPWGLILLAHELEGAFPPERKSLVNLIARQLGLALDNSELHQQMKELATHDQLTGLFNRHFLNACLNDLDNQLIDASPGLSCILLDLDNFKTINDTFGHLTGDAVLKQIAEIIQEEAKGMILARYGGEEFIILSKAGLDAALELAERLRRRVEKAEFGSGPEQFIKTTISCGVASIPENAKNGKELLSKADAALYQAKRNGRNRIECFSAE